MVYLMVGIQGSGKSTFSKEFSEKHHIPILSSDGIRASFPGVKEYIIWPYLYSQAYLYVKNHQDFILDATSINKFTRKRTINSIKNYGVDFDITAVYVKTSLETCLERVKLRNEDPNEHHVPLDVVERYYHDLEEPTLDEGFKDIIIVTNE